MTLAVKSLPAKPGQDALERLKGPSSKDIQAEKTRLRKATREFESFFIYQMLKTMRQTVPEGAPTKDAPMADGMGKETFTDIFDMEIARKTTLGGHNSIGDLLYNSMEKLIDAQFAQDSPRQTLKPLQQPPRSPVKLNESGPIELPHRVQRFKPVRTQETPLPLPSSRRPVTEDPILIKYGRFIHDAARETKIDTAVIASVIRAESGGNPQAVSKVGAKGLMQLTDTTAQALQVENAFDPKENIKAGSRYLRQMLDRFGDLKLALAAYNAGPGNVVKYGGVPPFAETKDYLERVARFISETAGDKLSLR